MTDPERVLHLERTFSAPIEAVFDAWTNVEVLKRWWGPGPDWTIPTAEVDLRVGGAMRIAMRSSKGEEAGGRGEFIVVERPHRITYRWNWDDGHTSTSQQVVDVQFVELSANSTQVRLTNRGLDDSDAVDDHREGWSLSFDNLDEVFR